MKASDRYNPEMVKLLLRLQKQKPVKSFNNIDELLAYLNL